MKLVEKGHDNIPCSWWLPDSDTHFQDYIEDGGYQIKHRTAILNHIKNHIKEFNNVIDVGSHVGFWSREFTE